MLSEVVGPGDCDAALAVPSQVVPVRGHSITMFARETVKNLNTCLLMLLVSGCGVAFLPQPTSKTVTPEDIAGTWQYSADFGKTTITLTLNADGSFVQTVNPTGTTDILSHSGVWKLDERNRITFTSVLAPSRESGWNAEEVHWWVTDGIHTRLAIFGGTHPDPDSWQEFKKLR